MKLLGVNSRKWSPEVIHAAVKTAQDGGEPIELLAENAQSIQTYSVPYHGGEKHPHLQPVAGQPDVLSDILKPLSP
jgi:hypothetical protein